VLHGLVQHLEPFVNLVPVVICDSFVHLDKLVKVADAAVLLASFIYSVAFRALLLPTRTLILQVMPHVAAAHFDHLTCVTEDRLIRADRKMTLQRSCPKRRVITLVRTRQVPQLALIKDVPLVLFKRDAVVTTFINTAERGTLEHLVDHRV